MPRRARGSPLSDAAARTRARTASVRMRQKNRAGPPIRQVVYRERGSFSAIEPFLGRERQSHRPASATIVAAAQRPPATSSATTPQPPRKACRRPIPRGLTTSSSETERKPRPRPRADVPAPGRLRRRPTIWPATSSMTMHPGSSASSARLTGPETEHPQKADGQTGHQQSDRRPENAVWNERPTRAPGRRSSPLSRARRARARNRNRWRETSGTGERRTRGGRRDIDTGSCRREDPSVLIASCSAFSEVYNRAERSRGAADTLSPRSFLDRER